MDIEKIKDEIKNNIKWDSKRPIPGGQQCGILNYPVILKSEELDLEITIGYHRSQLRNKELAYKLFELALNELIK